MTKRATAKRGPKTSGRDKRAANGLAAAYLSKVKPEMHTWYIYRTKGSPTAFIGNVPHVRHASGRCVVLSGN
jgi:hypothetical protein